ncbi:MAG: hypothetical protein D6714_04410 [Bacteroidetes bacterium]|nr:MAG: hypothetical protein D6714_04410 [Bacteroidota bacterium]
MPGLWGGEKKDTFQKYKLFCEPIVLFPANLPPKNTAGSAHTTYAKFKYKFKSKSNLFLDLELNLKGATLFLFPTKPPNEKAKNPGIRSPRPDPKTDTFFPPKTSRCRSDGA